MSEKTKRKQERFRWSTGSRPHTAAVEERTLGGVIYGRVWDPQMKRWLRESLKHRDKERAKAWALDQAAKLAKGDTAIRTGKVTLSMVFAAYSKHRTPRKTPGVQKADKRRSEMWTAVLGPHRDPHTISLSDWERFIDLRASGAIDARGREVPPEERRPVRARAVEADCNWLRWVFNWASKWRTQSGHYLMRENPVRGYEAPREENPRRPVATQDRYEAVRAKSDHVMMQTRWGKRATRRSYVSELLDIVNGTGRRISAVCRLTYEDLRLDAGRYGAIRWPASTDKMKRESVVPISPQVRRALDRILRERPGIGAAPLFPAPADAAKPITRYLADKWLIEAEKLAELEPQEGSLWHAYRRKWATERKHLPDVDVAAVGGWKSVQTLKTAYQQADAETMLRVVLEGGELREA
jgi:integrase